MTVIRRVAVAGSPCEAAAYPGLPAGRPPMMPAFHDTACRAMRLIEPGSGLCREPDEPVPLPAVSRTRRGDERRSERRDTDIDARCFASAVIRSSSHVPVIVITKRKELQFRAAEQRVGLERDVSAQQRDVSSSSTPPHPRIRLASGVTRQSSRSTAA